MTPWTVRTNRFIHDENIAITRSNVIPRTVGTNRFIQEEHVAITRLNVTPRTVGTNRFIIRGKRCYHKVKRATKDRQHIGSYQRKTLLSQGQT